MDVKLKWPSLPEERTNVAVRASQLCAIHATLSHPPEITISREAGGNGEKLQKPVATGMPAAASSEAIDTATSGP